MRKRGMRYQRADKNVITERIRAYIVLSNSLCLLAGSTASGCFESQSPLCPSGLRCPAGTFCAANEDICIAFSCGDGIADEGEVCDDGNITSGDGCRSDCKSKETCGNGELDEIAGETCDDGNTVGGDGCRSDCTGELCGDGIVDAQFFEACDNGAENSNAPDAECRVNCQPGRCGDGIEDSDEVCDDGNNLSGDDCSADCQSNEICGNGYVDGISGEQCDDNNGRNHDGCASNCTLEQPSWHERNVGVPPARHSHAMAYDTARRRIVLFGGGGDSVADDTWEWNGTSWHRVNLSGPRPSPRTDHAMAYDASRGRIVLFGGFDSLQHHRLDDTWEWDGAFWHRIAPRGSSPAPRSSHAMAYDGARSRVVLFGGTVSSGGRGRSADTWEWDGTSWQLIDPPRSPPTRRDHVMAYDVARGRVVLFGGTADRATWEWDGATWHRIVTPHYPPGLNNHTMAYDAARGRVVLFGVRDSSSHGGDTWQWDGARWELIEPLGSSPSPRRGSAMAYDASRGRVVLFGGAVRHGCLSLSSTRFRDGL